MSRRSSSSNTRVGFSSRSALVAFAVLLQLAFLADPAAAIGGWETIHLVWSRLSGERAQNESSKPSSVPQVAPIPNGGGHHDADDNEEDRSPKKRHVSEVTMTSLKKSSSSSSRSSTSVSPAFVPRNRRGGLKLDDKDLQTITFVGRTNPFL
eukprot:CAMPEP_0201687732 /NCGR_PEP_ID=MMETSP0578-20130828/1661_1 /ASSEMBLY_ACC=CAM_ASM_000663 /TAXON_ID=267565 /ORGANISM="Skeletonema grethea, Strain CCMP 1804" /LENGTH=151 /DNA_ID=CAMNT_0048171907 /DNA_START=129 /DNA_END=584 /DNA_ORIENTATION=+